MNLKIGTYMVDKVSTVKVYVMEDPPHDLPCISQSYILVFLQLVLIYKAEVHQTYYYAVRYIFIELRIKIDIIYSEEVLKASDQHILKRNLLKFEPSYNYSQVSFTHLSFIFIYLVILTKKKTSLPKDNPICIIPRNDCKSPSLLRFI